MDFINKNIIFQKSLTTKNYDDLIGDIAKISSHLRHFESVEIFLNSSYDFIITLLGAINAGVKAFVLSKEGVSLDCEIAINDSNICDFLGDVIESDSVIFDDSAYLDVPFFIQTSGSSKEYSDIIPKTLRAMILESNALAKTLQIKHSDIFIASPSHQHLFALTFKLFLPLLNGGIILDAMFKFPELVIEFCQNHRDKNLVFITTPTLLKYLCEQKNLSSLRSVKYIISAGARLDSAIRGIIKNVLDLDIFEVYGSTECGVIAFNVSDYFSAFDGVSLRLDGDSRLVIDSAWAFKRGFVSNDLAQIDGKKIYLKGRCDRIIKIHDKRVSLDFLESQIKNLNIILDCYVGIINNRIHCIITLNDDGKRLFLDKGKKGILNAIKALKIQEIRHFYIRESLPFNNQGKITKNNFIDSINAKILPRFEIIKSDENSLCARGIVDCGSFIFDGHFPSFPLVAGFIELDFVINLAKNYLNLGDIFEIESIKFTSFLRPYDEVKIDIYRKNDKLYFHIFANEKECTSGKIK